MIWIIISIIVISIIITLILIFSKNARENFWTSLISSLFLSIILILLTPYIISLITPTPKIKVICENLPDHNLVVQFTNEGNDEAESFYTIITNPEREWGDMVFIEPPDKELCNIKTFNYPDYENETAYYEFTSLKRVCKTAIGCSYLPQNYQLMVGHHNWMDWIIVKIWAKNLGYYEEKINCSWDIVCQNNPDLCIIK